MNDLKLVEAAPEYAGQLRQRRSDLAERFYQELLTGNRTTCIYTVDKEFVGGIDLVK